MPEPTHNNALPLGSMLMEYRLDSVLGAGGFGITYLARDTHLDKPVAIKEFMPASMAMRADDGTIVPTSTGQKDDYQWGLDRFAQEARTLAKFAHPHIVRVNRYFGANGSGYMVMDFEEGESLKSWLQQHPMPGEDEIRALFAPLLDGLEKVHAAGFLHRDIKPDNIFVRRTGGPVLIDFGSAREALVGATQSMTTIVTPGYAPFEQYTQTTKQGPWTDVYALAGVLYFLVTGQNPPDAITRMKEDDVPRGLGAARVRYSKAFIDAIAWGLNVDDAGRARSVADLRGAMSAGGATTLAGVAAAGSAMTVKTAAIGARQSGPGTARPVAAQSAATADRQTAPAMSVEARAALLTSHASRLEKERSRLPLGWIAFGVIMIVLMLIGVRMMSGAARKPAQDPAAAVAAPAPAPAAPATVAPAAAEVAAPVSSEPAPPVADGAALQQAGAAPVSTPAIAVPRSGALPVAGVPAVPPGELGLTREQFVQAYPHLADRFGMIDKDRDGRISPAELVDAMQQFSFSR